MPTDRRLIEDFLPVGYIGTEATSENSGAKGHIATLHVWKARRPLVEARAVVFGTLMPAPSTPEDRAMLKQEMIALCDRRILSDAVEHARERIRQAHDGEAPKVLDMFAGGGSIPLEALRLGCDAYALELNPVAHIIELCTLEYPQRFGQRLVQEVEKWGEWVIQQVERDTADLYPPVPDPEYHKDANQLKQLVLMGDVQDTQAGEPGYLIPTAYLWTRTARCPNPQCGADVPLARQTWLRKKTSGYVALRPAPDADLKRVRFELVIAENEDEIDFDPQIGGRGTSRSCLICGSSLPAKYIRSEGKKKRFGLQLLAVVCRRDDEQGKVYLAADDFESLQINDEGLAPRVRTFMEEFDIEPLRETIPPTGNAGLATGRSYLYGPETFGELFTNRQLLMLLTFVRYIRQAHDEMLTQGIDPELAQAVTAYLGLLLNKIADRSSTLSRWDNSRENIQGVSPLSRFAMSWDFPEVNPFGGASGDARTALSYLVAVIEHCADTGSPAKVHRASALDLPFDPEFFDAVITDPPYYDNISYSELSDYFRVWLKRSIGDFYPEHFSGDHSPRKAEVVAAAYRQGGTEEAAREAYNSMMSTALAEANRVLRPGSPLVIIYAHKTTAGWTTLIDSLRCARFVVTEAWPVDSELSARIGHQGDAALASNILIVARTREEEDTVGDYVRDVRPQLQSIIQERVETLTAEGISGADLVIAAVGAGLRAYTQYARVELASGEELDAAAYLDEVQREVLETVLTEIMRLDRQGVGRVDSPTRYYILGRFEYGTMRVPFDEANVLARGVGVELDAPHGLTWGSNPLVEKKKDKVRLQDYRERGDDEDLGLPSNGARAPLVDVLHRLLWLAEHAPLEVPQFLVMAQPDAGQLRLVAQALAGRALAAEPTPGAMRDTRTPEQGAVDRLLAAWRRVVEENLFVR